jgi:hypothetical protein
VLRRIFGPKRDEIIGSWRKLHSLSNTIRMIDLRRIKWEIDAAHMGERNE